MWIAMLFTFGEMFYLIVRFLIYVRDEKGYCTPWPAVKRSGATHDWD